MDVKRVGRTGVTSWEAEPFHRHLPRRILRHLGVSSSADAVLLTPEYEPFFQDTAHASASLRELLRDVGTADVCVHSTWLNRVETRGPGAERWLDAVGGDEWWSKDVTWRFDTPDLQVLAYSDTDFTTTSLYAWGPKARALFDAVATAWESLPKAPPTTD